MLRSDLISPTASPLNLAKTRNTIRYGVASIIIVIVIIGAIFAMLMVRNRT